MTTVLSIIFLFIYGLKIIVLKCDNSTWIPPEITCNNSTGTCLISCDFNNSCHDITINSTKFLIENLENSNQYISNLTSLMIECNEENACHDMTIDCNNFNVKNCIIGCLKDDSCAHLELLCYGKNIEQCFIYTEKSDSAIQYSTIKCNYSQTHDSFCGYKCGLESDGCYEDNICIDYNMYYGYQTNCSCKGLPEACDEITFKSGISTTTFVTTKEGNDNNSWFFDNLTDEILIFIGIGIILIAMICFLLVCVCKLRIKDGKIQRITKEYSFDNKTLNSGLLRNDALKNTQLSKKNSNGTINKNNKNTTSNLSQQQSNISYDDNAELGSFKMIPDAELGDDLFNGVVVDDDDDY